MYIDNIARDGCITPEPCTETDAKTIWKWNNIKYNQIIYNILRMEIVIAVIVEHSMCKLCHSNTRNVQSHKPGNKATL